MPQHLAPVPDDRAPSRTLREPYSLARSRPVALDGVDPNTAFEDALKSASALPRGHGELADAGHFDAGSPPAPSHAGSTDSSAPTPDVATRDDPNADDAPLDDAPPHGVTSETITIQAESSDAPHAGNATQTPESNDSALPSIAPDTPPPQPDANAASVPLTIQRLNQRLLFGTGPGLRGQSALTSAAPSTLGARHHPPETSSGSLDGANVALRQRPLNEPSEPPTPTHTLDSQRADPLPPTPDRQAVTFASNPPTYWGRDGAGGGAGGGGGSTPDPLGLIQASSTPLPATAVHANSPAAPKPSARSLSVDPAAAASRPSLAASPTASNPANAGNGDRQPPPNSHARANPTPPASTSAAQSSPSAAHLRADSWQFVHDRSFASQVLRGLNAAISSTTLTPAGAAAGASAVTIRLNPAALGQLRIRIKIEGDAVHARFEAASSQARGLLNSSSDELRSRLAERGLNLTRVEVADAQPPTGHSAAPDASARLREHAPHPVEQVGEAFAAQPPAEPGSTDNLSSPLDQPPAEPERREQQGGNSPSPRGHEHWPSATGSRRDGDDLRPPPTSGIDGNVLRPTGDLFLTLDTFA